MKPIRTVFFRPYQPRKGPIFTLSIIGSEYRYEGSSGRDYLHYRLRMKPWIGKSVILFERSDFGCSPLHGIDSDETVASLMNFLTLRPGDTDQEYFENYTQDQLDFCDQHAEYLGLCAYDRFNRDE